MSLAKIPFILGFTWGWNKSFTAPNPPATKEEFLPSYSMAELTFLSLFTKITKVFHFIVAIAEIATILASKYPSSTLSNYVLEALVWNQNMRLEAPRLSSTTTIGSILVTWGSLLRWFTFRHLGRFFRFELSIQKDHHLITTGPYSIVRHPGYAVCYLMTFPGWFAWNFGRGSWGRDSRMLDTPFGKAVWGVVVLFFMLPIIFSGFWRIEMEDEALRKHFGREWEEWATRVRYRMIPGVF